MKRLTISMVAIVAALITTAVAFAGTTGSNWHVGYYTSSGITLSNAQAASVPGGVATLNFTNQPNTALLVTNQKVKGSTLLGNMTGESVSANATISGVSPSATFTFGGPAYCGGTNPPYFRYYFETSSGGGFSETHYWWSNPVHADLVGNGAVSLALVPLTGANWSDYYGHFGNDPAYAAGFTAAVANVTTIGLSFGGDCFFENGVGTTDGSGTFVLNTYSAS